MIWDELPPIDLEANARRLMENIKKNVEEEPGWSAICVGPDEDCPSFTYTIGLMETFGHPELIVYGCKGTLAHGLIACAIEKIKEGTVFQDGVRYGGIMDGYDMEAKYHPPGEPLNWATSFYDQEVDAIQLVWPDAKGVFPDEEGFDEHFVGAQDQRTES